MSNCEVVLKDYVEAGNEPKESHFECRKCEIPNLGDNEVKLQTLFLSVDPYMRFCMNSTDTKDHKPFKPGEPLFGAGCGKVIESNNENFREGDILIAQKKLIWPWQKFVVFSEDDLQCLRKLDDDFPKDLLSASVGWLGMTALTAYFGLLDKGKPAQGDTVVVSAAAGATGSLVGQIAKVKKCRVIGITETPEKVKYVKELGFDEVIDIKGKDQEQLRDELRSLVPHGVDIYFDNVGGEISHAVIPFVKENGRIPICGQISQYHKEGEIDDLPEGLEKVIKDKNIEREWFRVSDYQDKYDKAWKELIQGAQEGKLKCRETVYEGIEKLPCAFLGLFKGQNIGKSIVKVCDDDQSNKEQRKEDENKER